MNGGAEVFCGRKNFSVDAREIAAVLDFLRGNAPWEFPEGTLSVAFLGDDEICRMHGEFLADFSKTDVITFPGDEIFSAPLERANETEPRPGGNAVSADETDEAFAGEICVCVDQALRVARELNVAPADELLLYLVHGWLHLAGFDDIADEDRRAMRAAEKTALALLRGNGLAPLKTATFPQ